MEMPVSYNGGESYIFFSYAHKDSQRVFPIIRRLQQDGFRVWYDDGIVPGTEWDDNIAEHVVGCACFVAALSENYMASDNCKDELQYSRDLKKPQVLLYLEDVALPSGMAMRLGNVAKVFYHKQEETGFYSELYQLSALYGLEDTELSEFASEARKKMRRRRILRNLVACVLIAAVSVGGALLYKDRQDRENTSTEPTELPQMMRSEVLVDNEQIKMTVLGTEADEGSYGLNVLLENKTDIDLNFYWGISSVNRFRLGTSLNETIYAGESTLAKMKLEKESLASAGILQEDISLIEGWIEVSSAQLSEDSTYYYVFYPMGEENIKEYSYTPKEGDQVLLDTEDYLFVITDHFYDSAENRYIISMLAQNRTDTFTRFMLTIDSINGYQFGRGSGPELPGGYTGTYEWSIEKEKMSTVGGPQFAIYGGLSLETEEREVLQEQSVTILPYGESDTIPAGWVSDIEDGRWTENDVLMMFWSQWGGENVNKILEFDIPAIYFSSRERDGYTYDCFEVWNRTDAEKDVKFVAMVGNSIAEISMHLSPNDVQEVYLLRNSRYGNDQPYTANIAIVEVDENGNYDMTDLQYMKIRLHENADQVLYPAS